MQLAGKFNAVLHRPKSDVGPATTGAYKVDSVCFGAPAATVAQHGIAQYDTAAAL